MSHTKHLFKEVLMSRFTASDLTRVLLFAPRNCTGNSGAIGDTILQTSFVRTLLDRSLFPDLQEIHWWGTKWVIDQLFDYFHREVVVHKWAGEADELGNDPQYSDLTRSVRTSRHGESAVFICTRNESVEEKIKADSGERHCLVPEKPLDAQSPVHLSRQLHSCLDRFGIYISDLPQPRIVVTEAEIDCAMQDLTWERLKGECELFVEGKHPYELGVDRVFLLYPGLKHGVQDRRTWGIDKWRELVRILGEVGVVIVACDARDVAEARAEANAAQEIVAGEQTYNWRFAKKLPLKKLSAWACASTVCVARDSGPMHVAAASVGPKGPARVLGLFSVMCPGTWRPLSDNFEGMGQWPLPLEPYVTPDEVAVQATH
jgi:hypothetical protein